jgi:transposase
MVQAEGAGSGAAGRQQEDRAALFVSRYRTATQWTYPAFVDTYYRGSVRGKESTLRRHTHYSTEFRAEAVRLAGTSGESIRQVAMDLGISNESLRRWIALARERPAGTPLDDDERAELVELRRKVKTLQTEREILRKAAAFFASETERTR